MSAAIRPEVLTEAVGNVLVVTLNREHVRNAVNTAMAEGVAGALDELDRRRDLVAGVLTGAGSTFCSGMDLKAFLAGERPGVPGRGFAGIVERGSDKPLIAAVEGHAIAGGFEIVLACDLVVASETAAFGLPEVKRGLVAAAGGLFRLPQRVPYQLAMEMALTGEFVPAERARELGLVNRLVPAGEAASAALELAAAIARNGPLAVAATKRIITLSRDWSAEESFDRQRPMAEDVRSSEDAREGARAFTEKRPPRWSGK
ncbi:crotonase/enoyl-CoA hydratase family protein [Streptomyces adelaidensis]|uniref:crotonase/enoyl-CoA hydratase family protein n=1 Tax=Streptomyces adelaidensis TaxID=2796465 RepID=UPI0019076FAA|nr:crotonase/enoyl-CoA hydratase family protein [Streptomyces adelaidensis]